MTYEELLAEVQALQSITQEVANRIRTSTMEGIKVMARYKMTWEMVGVSKLHKYSNADPMFYKNTTQIVPNSQIPDEDWHPMSVEFDEHEYEQMRRDQYKNLKQWADEDSNFVRNVHLYMMPGTPDWEEIDG